MALLGPLDPRQQQAQQQAAITAQSQHWEDELTKMLREGGQHNAGNFTSPWQVAGQMAQALSGRMHAGQNAQNYASLNAALAPGEGGGGEGGQQQAAAAPMPANTPAAPEGAPQSKHGGTPFSPEVKQAIMEGSQAVGVDPKMMAMFAHIESDGNPHSHTGNSKYKGLMQLDEGEMHQISNGQGNVWNPKDATMAAGLISKRNAAAFEKFSGRQASPFDLYMMHQQGPAGYMQHVAQPNAPAVQNMLGTAEGRAKGPRWAHEAIVENGGHAGDTSAQFIARWRAKFDRMAQGDMGAFQGGQQTASLTPMGGGGQAPGAQGTQVAQAGPGGGLIERGQFFGPGGYPAPQATYDAQHLDTLARRGMLSPEQINTFRQQQIGAQQPRTREVPGMGTYMLDPRSGQESYLPQIQTKNVKVGEIEVPQQFYIDSKGRQHVIGGETGAQGASPAPGPQGQNEPFPSSGSVSDIAGYGERRTVRMTGEKTAAEEAAKVGPETKKAIDIEAGKVPLEIEKKKGELGAEYAPNIIAGKTALKEGEEKVTGQQKLFNTIYAGLTGQGMNSAQQARLLHTMRELAPKAYTGAGADTMLALNQLADKVGLTERAAAPRELFSQLANKLINDQFAGLRNLSGEEGAQAMKVFKSMLDIEEKSGINAKTSLSGIMAQLDYAEQEGKRAIDWAKKVHANGGVDAKFMSDLIDEIADTKVTNPLGAEQTKEIGGKKYYKRGGKWYTE